MDENAPRTIRPPEHSTMDQPGVAATHSAAEQGQISTGDNPQTSTGQHDPYTAVGLAGQDTGTSHAEARPADTPRAAAIIEDSSDGLHANPVSKNQQFHKIVGKGGYENLNYKIRRAYKLHTYQYWFVATTSNALLFLQVLIAASLTVLGAFNDRRARTATIFLGAANTVIAGLLTYFKSRNQPNRARQLRNDLGRVVDQLDDAEATFRMAYVPAELTASIQSVRQAYQQARMDAEVNYPDLWVKAGDTMNPFRADRGDNANEKKGPSQVQPNAATASGALNEPPQSARPPPPGSGTPGPPKIERPK